MAWFIDAEPIDDHLLTESTEISFNDICCDTKMKMVNENSVKCYICELCGKFYETTELFNNINDYERKIHSEKKRYGLSNEKNNKNLISKILTKIQSNFHIKESEIINIIKNYSSLRARQIFRGKKKDAIILMCIVKNTGIPTNSLLELFNIKQTHLTDAHKLIQYELSPFDNMSIKEFCDEKLTELKHLKIDLNLEDNIYKFIIKLMVLSVTYYIGHDRRLGTIFYSIIYYLIITNYIDYDYEKLFSVVKIQKNTIYKYFDILLIYLNSTEIVNKEYSENFIFRHKELVRFFNSEGIKILTIQGESRFDKYRHLYLF